MFPIVLNDQKVSMTKGSKDMVSYKKVFLWLSLPQVRGKLTHAVAKMNHLGVN